MLGTHASMLEAIKDGVDVFYITAHVEQSLELISRAKEIYAPYGFTPYSVCSLTKDKQTLTFFSLQKYIEDRLRGTRGAILLHPDVLEDEMWTSNQKLQDLISQTNKRSRPWLN